MPGTGQLVSPFCAVYAPAWTDHDQGGWGADENERSMGPQAFVGGRSQRRPANNTCGSRQHPGEFEFSCQRTAAFLNGGKPVVSICCRKQPHSEMRCIT